MMHSNFARSSVAVVACFFLAQGNVALAQTKSTERITESKTTQKRIVVKGASTGISAILGAEYGYMEATPSQKQLFEKKKGTVLELKAMAGFLLKDFLLDTGLGWYSYKIRGKEVVFVPVSPEDGSDAEPTTEQQLGDREMGVSGILVEFSPSYRLTNNIFSGLVMQVRSPAQLSYVSDAKVSGAGFSLGLQAGYQIFNSDLNSRILIKVMSNLGLKNWQDIAFMGGVQFGLPIRQPDSLVIRRTTTIGKVKDVLEYQKKDFTITIRANVIKLALDNIVNFYVRDGRPTLTPESQSFLVDLGASLQSAISSWETLRIDAESAEHITVVRESLVSTGVPPDKVKAGRTLGAVNDGGNISVDFTFTGVRNPRTLASAIRKAMNAMQIPENCQKGTCE